MGYYLYSPMYSLYICIYIYIHTYIHMHIHGSRRWATASARWPCRRTSRGRPRWRPGATPSSPPCCGRCRKRRPWGAMILHGKNGNHRMRSEDRTQSYNNHITRMMEMIWETTHLISFIDYRLKMKQNQWPMSLNVLKIAASLDTETPTLMGKQWCVVPSIVFPWQLCRHTQRCFIMSWCFSVWVDVNGHEHQPPSPPPKVQGLICACVLPPVQTSISRAMWATGMAGL